MSHKSSCGIYDPMMTCTCGYEESQKHLACNHTIDSLKAEIERVTDQKNKMWFALAESQATNAKLREALEAAKNGLMWWMDNLPHDVTEADYEEMEKLDHALAIPNDSTALDAVVAERTASLTAKVESGKYNYLGAIADCREYEQQNAELTAQRDAAMKDAERYRWLKANGNANSKLSSKAIIYRADSNLKAEVSFTYWCSDLDNHIDAAIAVQSAAPTI